MFFLLCISWIVVIVLVIFPKYRRKEISRSTGFIAFAGSLILTGLFIFLSGEIISAFLNQGEHFLFQVIELLLLFIFSPVLVTMVVLYVVKRFRL